MRLYATRDFALCQNSSSVPLSIYKSMYSQITRPKPVMEQFKIDKYQAAEIVNLSHHTVTAYRREGKLVEGVHWCYLSPRTTRYCEHRLRQWVAFSYDTKAQMKYINEIERGQGS